MIHGFSVSNFFSIKSRQDINFRVARNATAPDGHFAMRGQHTRLPKVISIFGANASGKTNILKALVFLKHFITESYLYQADEKPLYWKFYSKDVENVPTIFEVEFCIPERLHVDHYIYKYELHLREGKVVYESLSRSLNGKSKTLFIRKLSKIQSSEDFELPNRDPVKKKIRKNTSVLSVLAQFNHRLSLEIVRAVECLFTNVNIAGKIHGNSHKLATDFYHRNKDIFVEFNEFIQWADFGIESVLLRDDENGISPLFHHAGLSNPIMYWAESGGTRAMYILLPYILKSLRTGGITVLDELDADLHPILMPKIVELFHDKTANPYDAQLIFSAHNATIMRDLCKEEIYFTEKSIKGETHFYGLKEIKDVRRNENFTSKYLSGIYGAIPNV